jgi:hypothetical protein
MKPSKPKALGEPTDLSINRSLEELVGRGEVKESLDKDGKRRYKLTDRGLTNAVQKIKHDPDTALFFLGIAWNIPWGEFRKHENEPGACFQFALSLLKADKMIKEKLGMKFADFLQVCLDKAKKEVNE